MYQLQREVLKNRDTSAEKYDGHHMLLIMKSRRSFVHMNPAGFGLIQFDVNLSVICGAFLEASCKVVLLWGSQLVVQGEAYKSASVEVGVARSPPSAGRAQNLTADDKLRVANCAFQS